MICKTFLANLLTNLLTMSRNLNLLQNVESTYTSTRVVTKDPSQYHTAAFIEALQLPTDVNNAIKHLNYSNVYFKQNHNAQTN